MTGTMRNEQRRQVLIQARLRQGWTQADLAENMGVATKTIARWENGITSPQPGLRARLGALLHLDSEELWPLAASFPAGSSTHDEQDSHSLTGQAEPPIWNIPYPRNPFFTGREDLLSQLYQSFHADQAITPVHAPQALSGLGGVGKTQVALEYAYRYRERYQAVLWAQAETSEALTSSYCSIAELLELPQREDSESEHIVSALRDWLRTHQGWLLILDNVDELAWVRTFLPPLPGGHVLLTTRAQAMGRLARSLEVESLPAEQGILFLLRRTGLLATDAGLEQAVDEEWEQAHRIYDDLGGLPLALDQAGSYIEETGCSLMDYHQLFQSRRARLLAERRGLIEDHPLPVASTWSLSFEHVAQKRPAAADLLRFCAFLAPEAIPQTLLLNTAPHLNSHLALVCTDPYPLHQAIEALRAYSLLHRESKRGPVPFFSVHRLVQAVLKDEMDQETEQLWASRTVEALGITLPEEDRSCWEYYEHCLPHIHQCVQLITQWHITSEAAMRLLSQAGAYLFARSRYTQAEPLLRLALHMREQASGSDQWSVATALYRLALLYQERGQYIQAEPLLQRALHIWEQNSGPGHAQIAHTVLSLALLYRDRGQYDLAEIWCVRALSIWEQTLGSDHPQTTHPLHVLAQLYRRQGRYDQAEPLFLRALRMREQSLGADHCDVAMSLHGLAQLYQDQGQHAQAGPLFQRALNIWEQALGPDHHQVAYPLLGLANLSRDQGQYAAAEAFYLRALHIWEQTVHPDHPEIAYAASCFANLYRDQGRYAAAEALYLRALRIWERVVRPDLHYIQGARKDYALLLRALGRTEEACSQEGLAERFVLDRSPLTWQWKYSSRPTKDAAGNAPRCASPHPEEKQMRRQEETS